MLTRGVLSAALLASAGSLIVPARTAAAQGAVIDGTVNFLKVSHISSLDRVPRAPLNGEPFEVQFRAVAGDVAEAALVIDLDPANAGGEQTAAMSVVGQRGGYDVWAATVPAASGQTLEYYIRLSDGPAVGYIGRNGAQGSVPAPFVIDFATLSHVPYGATPVPASSGGGVVFRVWAPTTTNAWVFGDFSNGLPMTRVGADFVRYVPEAQVGQDYKFRFDGGLSKSDPRSLSVKGASNFDSIITDPASFEWQNPGFVPAPQEELVIYQLHVPSFAGLNDPFGPAGNPSGFLDVAERVSHLEELGVNAVMLNPVYEYPGVFSGGYNPLSMYHLEESLGTVEDFQTMVDTLHGAGIAVLLDTVWNHFDGNQLQLWMYDGEQIYFDTPAVGTPWGDQADFDDPNVRQYFIDSALVYMDDLRVDGWRHDAVFEIVNANQQTSGRLLMRQLNGLLDRRYDYGFNIAEIYDNNPTNTRPFNQGGYGFTAQYHEAFKNAVHDEVGAVGPGDPNIDRLANTADGSGSFVEGEFVMNYFALHDDEWPLNNRVRQPVDYDPSFPHDSIFARSKVKLGQGLTLLAKGVPAIVQGSEWLESIGWESRIDWSKKETYDGIFAFHRDLIGLRTGKEALFANSGYQNIHVNNGGNVWAFERWGDDGRSYVVLANLSETSYGDYRIGLPRPGEWGVIINSEDPFYDGEGGGTPSGTAFTADAQDRDGQGQSASLSLAPRSILLLQHEPEFLEQEPVPGPCVADVNKDGNLDFSDVSIFIQAFNLGAADFNMDGVTNFGDISGFVAAFNAGCP